MNSDDARRDAQDVSFRQVGIGLPVYTKTCGNCMKPKSTAGGRIGYVRGLVKKGFICAQCSERMAAK